MFLLCRRINKASVIKTAKTTALSFHNHSIVRGSRAPYGSFEITSLKNLSYMIYIYCAINGTQRIFSVAKFKFDTDNIQFGY